MASWLQHARPEEPHTWGTPILPGGPGGSARAPRAKASSEVSPAALWHREVVRALGSHEQPKHPHASVFLAGKELQPVWRRDQEGVWGRRGESSSVAPPDRGTPFSFRFSLVMWLEVPSLTVWTGDTLCYFAAVCLWAESLPESLSLTFLTAKWGCCAQGWGGDSSGPCPPWTPRAGVVSPAPQLSMRTNSLWSWKRSHVYRLRLKEIQERGQPPEAVYSQLEGPGGEQS